MAFDERQGQMAGGSQKADSVGECGDRSAGEWRWPVAGCVANKALDVATWQEAERPIARTYEVISQQHITNNSRFLGQTA